MSAPPSTRIVLVHGLGASARWWHRVVPFLRDFDVEYADPRRAFGVAEDAVLVGHSLGGMRAAQVAATTRPRKLVLVAPAGIPTGRRFAVEALELLRSTTPRHLPTVAVDCLRWGPGLVHHGLEATRTRVDARAIDVPTLIVWGGRDTLVPTRLAAQWHETIAGSRLEILPGVRHVPMLEAPSAFAEVLLHFLRDESGSGVVDGVPLPRNDDDPAVG